MTDDCRYEQHKKAYGRLIQLLQGLLTGAYQLPPWKDSCIRLTTLLAPSPVPWQAHLNWLLLLAIH